MASELTISAELDFTKGTVSISKVGSSTKFTVTGTKYVQAVQSIGVTAEALGLGDIGTPGYIIIFNRDATNFVEIRDGSGGADVVKLKAGEFALFRLATATPYLIADTAIVVVEYVLIEN